jgi:hypothetical protein
MIRLFHGISTQSRHGWPMPSQAWPRLAPWLGLLAFNAIGHSGACVSCPELECCLPAAVLYNV